MAFGDLLGTLTGNGGSVGSTNALSGSVSVAVGDLVFVCFGQQSSLTASGVTDNLGNTYTAQNTGNDTGSSTGRAFYSRVTAAGTLTTCTVAATSSSLDYAGLVAVIAGPFLSSPVDKNPANVTADATSPFTCPSTGTLGQENEVVIAWGTCTSGTNATWAATSPNTLAGQTNNSTNIKAVIGYQTVGATGSVTPEFTAGSNPGDACLGTVSFKGSQRAFTSVKGDLTLTGNTAKLTDSFAGVKGDLTLAGKTGSLTHNTRHWVGGTGTWDSSSTTHWSTWSGGTAGASVPDSANAVIIDGNSGGGTVTLSATTTINSLNCTGFTGTFSDGGVSNPLNLYGSLTYASGMTLSYTSDVTFKGSGSKNFTSAGKTIGHNIVVMDTTYLYLADSVNSTADISLDQGTSGHTLDLNNFSHTFNNVALDGIPAWTLKMGSGTLTTKTFVAYARGSASIIPSTSTIKFTGTSSEMYSGGFTYNNFEYAPTASGSFAFSNNDTNSPTFNDFKITPASSGITYLYFKEGQTYYITTLTMPANNGNNISFNSYDSTNTWTLSCASGTITAYGCTIEHSIATGGATFNAITTDGNVNGGGNTGWNFSPSISFTAVRGDLTLTGYSGTLTDAFLLSKGDLAIAGEIISLASGLIAVKGDLTLEGQTGAALGISFNGVNGDLILLSQASAITSEFAGVSGVLSLNGLAINFADALNSINGDLTLNGSPISISQGQQFLLVNGDLVFSTDPASLVFGFSGVKGDITLFGNGAALSDVFVSLNGTLNVSGHSSAWTDILTPVYSELSLTGNALQANSLIQLINGNLVFDGFSTPIVYSLNASSGSLVLSGYDLTADIQSRLQNIDLITGDITVSGYVISHKVMFRVSHTITTGSNGAYMTVKSATDGNTLSAGSKSQTKVLT